MKSIPVHFFIGTKSWVQGFNSDQFLESLGGAQVEDGVESEDEGDPDLLVLTLDQKRKMLSTLINRSSKALAQLRIYICA